jgi:hypothetical protein
MMARKVHVYLKNWEFHRVTPPKCQKFITISKTISKIYEKGNFPGGLGHGFRV